MYFIGDKKADEGVHPLPENNKLLIKKPCKQPQDHPKTIFAEAAGLLYVCSNSTLKLFGYQ
jgi:hypothetical protein